MHLDQSEMCNTMESVLLGQNGEGTGTSLLSSLSSYLQMCTCFHVLPYLTLTTTLVDVMFNFTLQLRWATVSRYLVKHYSGSFCEGVFWIGLIFQSVDFE